MLALTQFTSEDQVGATGEEVTADQVGSPEREMDVTCQPRAAAALQIRLPEGDVLAWLRSSGLVKCTKEAIATCNDDFLGGCFCRHD